MPSMAWQQILALLGTTAANQNCTCIELGPLATHNASAFINYSLDRLCAALAWSTTRLWTLHWPIRHQPLYLPQAIKAKPCRGCDNNSYLRSADNSCLPVNVCKRRVRNLSLICNEHVAYLSTRGRIHDQARLQPAGVQKVPLLVQLAMLQVFPLPA